MIFRQFQAGVELVMHKTGLNKKIDVSEGFTDPKKKEEIGAKCCIVVTPFSQIKIVRRYEI